MGVSPTAKEQAELLPKIKKNARKASQRVAENHQVIMGHDGETIEFDSDMLNEKKVITVMNGANTSYTIPRPSVLGYRLTKLHIEHCENCIFHLEHAVITSHIEVAHCKNVTFNIGAHIATLQIDASEDISLNYDEGMFKLADTKIFHVGVKAMRVTHGEHTHHADCVEDATRLTVALDHDEIQFMTTITERGFITQRVARKDGDLLPSPVEQLKDKEEKTEDKPRTLAERLSRRLSRRSSRRQSHSQSQPTDSQDPVAAGAQKEV
mmetsp:Transcript_13447/g.16709  ORF Transcript_13447/g.16709 Transcript_13447/m.16709 type:complete len:266 (+) Transcript_13447:288-1085(+)